ncbi:MAG: hypothetical protein PHP46_03665 [Candidatus Omnitrophica bacterium]|nr:hypothetical protein [Candidatus Omnitrophota bacterium]
MKKGAPVILAIVFLAQSIQFPQELSCETYALNPQSKVNLTEYNSLFRHKCEAVCLALFIYKMDALNGSSKRDIMDEYGTFLADFAVRFDLENMDMGRKGWTRYYPFSIEGKDFIARVFLTRERAHRVEVPVLFESSLKKLPITIQILPNISSILESCKIRPHRYNSDLPSRHSV